MSAPCILLSLQIGVVEPLLIDGRQIMSGIRKKPVTRRIAVAALGLEGDEQADLSVHGGLNKAIYAYPAAHYRYWREQYALDDAALPFGSLGENLTIAGLLETEACVGDELHFPDCVLRITQPRLPCFKFNAIMGDRQAAKKMAHSGFSGFYLAVASPGSLAAGDAFEWRPGPRQVAIPSLLHASRFNTRSD